MDQGCTLQPPPQDEVNANSPPSQDIEDIERRRRRLSGYNGGQWAGIELETVVRTSSADQGEELTQMLQTPEVIYGDHTPPPSPPSPPPPYPPPDADDIERRRTRRRLLGNMYNAQWVYGVPNVTLITTSSTGELLLFAVTSASSCAESLAYGPDALTETSSAAYLSTEHRDVLHTRWRQVLKADGTSANATIDWMFYDEKTLQERFEAAAGSGERVRWSITDEADGAQWSISGTWWFSDALRDVASKFAGSGGSFSDDDGAWGAGSGDVNGNSNVPSDFWGHGNFNSGDSECAIVYLGSSNVGTGPADDDDFLNEYIRTTAAAAGVDEAAVSILACVVCCGYGPPPPPPPPSPPSPPNPASAQSPSPLPVDNDNERRRQRRRLLSLMDQGCTLQPPPQDEVNANSPPSQDIEDIERRRRRLSGYNGGQWAGIELETVVRTSSAEQAEELTQMLQTPEWVYGVPNVTDITTSSAGCSRGIVSTTITTVTQDYGYENSWDLGYGCQSSLSYSSYAQYTQQCCLPSNTGIVVTCYDSYGDGWHGGYLMIGQTQACLNFQTGSTYTETVQSGTSSPPSPPPPSPSPPSPSPSPPPSSSSTDSDTDSDTGSDTDSDTDSDGGEESSFSQPLDSGDKC
ncbi:hypothetical protein CYMTET_17312 [Cymbomonas tetramitiformis]|uniref:Uncharacterized protein n=1 Tax=Cymbomonas tetramitiformis TaxID=36881 RepID=A0AAE0L793_9CHLO|nr:hypothetical protein CYMTET_17312 [Cymbomonas tetramitiformis]